MRVAVVCPYDLAEPGGVQDQVIGLVGRLQDGGHEAWAVAPGRGGPPGTRHVGPTLRVRANRSRAPISLSPRTPAKVRAALTGADVVHVHEPLMPATSLAVLRAGGPPLVGTFHADPGAMVRGVYRGAAPVLRRLAGRLHVATAVSEIARAAVASFVDARIVPNAVDVASLRATVAEPVPGRVLFVGRDESRKGLDVLVAAWPAVRAAHPSAELHVVGADRKDRPGGITFLGRIPEQEKRRELAEAVVLAAPNLGGESFGIVLIEAMASKCAVVASDLPAFRAVAGSVGTMVPPGDAMALTDAIASLLGDPREAVRAAEAGARRVERFDWPVVLEAYLDAYREAAEAAS